MTEFNPAYIHNRRDVVSLLKEIPSHILDVGCSNGTLGQDLKRAFPNATVIGIEKDPAMAKVATNHLDEVIVTDLDNAAWSDNLTGHTFDLIICADVLGHLKKPWEVLYILQQLLTPEGYLIISLPNVRHWSVIYQVFVKGDWPILNSGIFDKTHLRFFTKRSAKRLMEKSSLTVEKIVAKHSFYDDVGTPRHGLGRFISRIPGAQEFVSYQWIFICRK